jgi:hypothetical protein
LRGNATAVQEDGDEFFLIDGDRDRLTQFAPSLAIESADEPGRCMLKPM